MHNHNLLALPGMVSFTTLHMNYKTPLSSNHKQTQTLSQIQPSTGKVARRNW